MKVRIRFSLRTLAIAIMLFAVGPGVWVYRGVRQQQAKQWVLDSGGHLIYAHQWDESKRTYSPQAAPPVPAWLVRVVGIDMVATVIFVTLDRDEIGDLRPIADMEGLRSLALMNYIDEQTDFTPLQSLRRLETIRLDYTGLTAERLDELRRLLPGVEIIFDA